MKKKFFSMLMIILFMFFLTYKEVYAIDLSFISQPTDYLAVEWNNEIDAYDWDNNTNADLISASSFNDLDLITFNTSDSSSETIISVDIYIRADWLFSNNDYITFCWYVVATQGTGTYEMNAGNQGSDQLITFIDVVEPINAIWNFTDIYNLKFTFDFTQMQTPDTITIGIDEVWIEIFYSSPIGDTTPPDITNPIDQEVEYGATGNSIVWTVGDTNPNDYIIYRNDSNVESGSWTNGTLDANSGELDGLALGIYNITLWVDDIEGNSATDLVYFTVSDSVNPILTNPANIEYEYNSNGNTIVWVATDLLPDDYEVYKNSSLYDCGDWISGNDIIIDIDGLGVGIYNFTIFVNDTSTNFDIDLVYVTVTIVVDNQNPIFYNNPDNATYIYGITGNTVFWNGTDQHPHIYLIIRNGSEINNGFYTNNTFIIQSLDGLGVGIYNFTCFINDTNGNFIFHFVWITINASVEPTVIYGWFQYMLLYPEEHIVGLALFTIIICAIVYILIKRVRK